MPRHDDDGRNDTMRNVSFKRDHVLLLKRAAEAVGDPSHRNHGVTLKQFERVVHPRPAIENVAHLFNHGLLERGLDLPGEEKAYPTYDITNKGLRVLSDVASRFKVDLPKNTAQRQDLSRRIRIADNEEDLTRPGSSSKAAEDGDEAPDEPLEDELDLAAAGLDGKGEVTGETRMTTEGKPAAAKPSRNKKRPK